MVKTHVPPSPKSHIAYTPQKGLGEEMETAGS